MGVLHKLLQLPRTSFPRHQRFTGQEPAPVEMLVLHRGLLHHVTFPKHQQFTGRQLHLQNVDTRAWQSQVTFRLV